jgi:hypothetical protein
MKVLGVGFHRIPVCTLGDKSFIRTDRQTLRHRCAFMQERRKCGTEVLLDLGRTVPVSGAALWYSGIIWSAVFELALTEEVFIINRFISAGSLIYEALLFTNWNSRNQQERKQEAIVFVGRARTRVCGRYVSIWFVDVPFPSYSCWLTSRYLYCAWNFTFMVTIVLSLKNNFL